MFFTDSFMQLQEIMCQSKAVGVSNDLISVTFVLLYLSESHDLMLLLHLTYDWFITWAHRIDDPVYISPIPTLLMLE